MMHVPKPGLQSYGVKLTQPPSSLVSSDSVLFGCFLSLGANMFKNKFCFAHKKNMRNRPQNMFS